MTHYQDYCVFRNIISCSITQLSFVFNITHVNKRNDNTNLTRGQEVDFWMYLMCMQDERGNTCSSCSRFLLISFYMLVLSLRIFPFPHSEHAQSSHRLFIHNNKRLKIDQTSATSGQQGLTQETTHRLLLPPIQVSFNWVADVVAVADYYRGPGDDPPCKQSTPPCCEKRNDSWGSVIVL